MLILGGAANLNFNLTHPEFLKNQYQKNFLGTFTVYFYYSSQNIRRIKLLIRGGALNYQHMISTRPHMKTLHIWSLCAGFYRGLLWSFEKRNTNKNLSQPVRFVQISQFLLILVVHLLILVVLFAKSGVKTRNLSRFHV